MKTDFDLETIRGLGTEPSAESLARTWYRMTKPPKRQRFRALTPVAAAATVMVLAGASFLVYRAGSGVFWPVASTRDTISMLNTLADKASTGVPVPVPPEQLIRVHMDGLAGECGPNSCVIKPQTGSWQYDVHAGRSIHPLADGAKQASATESSDELPPGIRRPTLTWLASLPTDPEKLLSQLRIGVGEHERWTVDGQLWDAMGALYTSCELALTPQQRAALLRAFTGMTGLSTRRIIVDGRELVAIRHTDDTNAQELLFDPDTGRAVGRASYYLGPDLTITDPFEPGGMSRLFWTQELEPRS